MLQMLDRIDRNLRARVEKVVAVAAKYSDRGIVEWADRAARDAVALGRIRDRDMQTLERLEDTYSHDFYRGNSRNRSNPIYA